MKNVIVGTAGHVDHGKTCLIKALTGTDADRLKEEKKRGITIELGFASLRDCGDLHIGIIDVPGHEKFVKNMLAGVGGMDLVLLVIALDEGIMPQTREHFEILKNIGAKKGIIVYTKSDLANEEMVSLIDLDVTTMVKNSFLENAKRIKVSSYTGENIDNLRNLIIEQCKNINERRSQKELTRLPIDRVFTMEGFGTVVTGSLLEGEINVGDELCIYPKGLLTRVRQLESHNEKSNKALCGQRTAINLTGINKEDLERGDIVAWKDSMFVSFAIDVSISLFESCEKKLKNGDRVHVNYGACQKECRVLLVGKKEILAGEKAYAQLRFDEGISVKKGDRFIIRFLSPVITMGGGVILDPEASKHKKDDNSLLPYLKLIESGNDEKVIEKFLEIYSYLLPDDTYICKKFNLSTDEEKKIINSLLQKNLILKLKSGEYVSSSYVENVVKGSNVILEDFLKSNPVLKGMNKEEFKNKIRSLSKIYDLVKLEKLINLLIDKSKISQVEGLIATNSAYKINKPNGMEKMYKDVERIYKEALYEVPTIETVLEKFKDKKSARQIITDLTKQKILVKVDNDIYYHRDSFNKALELMYKHYETNKEMTLAEFRNMIGSSRKFSLYILDTCDRLRITEKIGDTRILLKKMVF